MWASCPRSESYAWAAQRQCRISAVPETWAFPAIPAATGTTQICHYRLRPFLPGVTIRALEKSSGTGYYLVVVPRSADAPHAVLQADDGHVLSFPVREETQTRWLSEAEIASRYRQRFISRDELEQTLQRVHAEGCAHLGGTVEQPWLAVSLAPAIAGARGVGTRAFDTVNDTARKWLMKTVFAVMPSVSCTVNSCQSWVCSGPGPPVLL